MIYFQIKRHIEEVQNIEDYVKNFDLNKFIESINLKPVAWSQSRSGRDDYWGVDIRFQGDFKADRYFWFIGVLFNPSIGEVYRDSAYTSGISEKNTIEKSGMPEENIIANKVTDLIRQSILTHYSSKDHLEILTALSKFFESTEKFSEFVSLIDTPGIGVNELKESIHLRSNQMQIYNLSISKKLAMLFLNKSIFKNYKINCEDIDYYKRENYSKLYYKMSKLDLKIKTFANNGYK